MSEKIIQPPTYYAVFAALIALTFLTVGVSFLELGVGHTYVGLGIALAKAALVVLIFMHLAYSTRLTKLVAAAALFWFGIMMVLTLTDYLTRHFFSY